MNTFAEQLSPCMMPSAGVCGDHSLGAIDRFYRTHPSATVSHTLPYMMYLPQVEFQNYWMYLPLVQIQGVGQEHPAFTVTDVQHDELTLRLEGGGTWIKVLFDAARD